MRLSRATLVVAFTSLLIGAAPASALAAPADVNVRVEGVENTVFDGVVSSDARSVRASSDTEDHVCDGTNLGANPDPGPTATGATVDAMASLGLDFDGNWYAGFEDYFLTRWGGESDSGTYWWGILVNRAFTPVGGCQYRVRSGDEVLWVNDAFGSRPFLWLDGPASGGEPLTVNVGEPLTVTVTSADAGAQEQPYATAAVGAVTATGQPAAAGVLTPGASGADGTATVTFHQAGRQRLKARATADDPGTGHPAAIASNSIEVIVRGPAPAPDPVLPQPQPRDPQPQPLPQPQPQPQPDTTPVGVERPRITAAGAADGRVTVSWRISSPGVGVRGWTVAAKPLGSDRAAFTTRASGTSATSAALRLPAGRTYALRFTLTDTLGRSSTTAVGRVLVPVDDRASAVRYEGAWRQASDRAAWRRTVSRGGEGARLRVDLAAGRPVVVLRGAGTARVELRANGRRETFALGRGRAGQVRNVVGAHRARGGTVELRVLRGEVSVDGAGVRP